MNMPSKDHQDHLNAQVRLSLKLFSQYVNRRRNARRMSQEDVAAWSGLSRTEVTRLEAGGTDPKLSTFIRVCVALGLGIGETASHLEHQVDHPEHRIQAGPHRTQRGRNTRRALH